MYNIIYIYYKIKNNILDYHKILLYYILIQCRVLIQSNYENIIILYLIKYNYYNKYIELCHLILCSIL